MRCLNTEITRRKFGVTAAATVAACATAPIQPNPDPASGQALYSLVQAYSDLGDHRTGSPGDHATTRWLERKLHDIGLTPHRQGWDMEVFDVTRSQLSWTADHSEPSEIEGFPLWPPIPTPGDGVLAPLSATPGEDRITVLTLPYSPSGSLESEGVVEAISTACSSGAVGVAVLTEGPLGELIAQNTEFSQPRWPVPVLIVPGRAAATLSRLIERQTPVRLRIAGRARPDTVHNVLGHRTGTGPGVVISTPKSGWFRCAGERGSGMAVALALAEWCARETELDVRFVSATGHEFHGEGARRFLAADPPRPETVALWVHIGANIAVNEWQLDAGGTPGRRDTPSTRRGIACHPALHAAVTASFAGQPGYGAPINIGAGRVPGETQHFADHGYSPLIGMVGAGPLHHTPADTAVATSPALLEPVARGLIGAVQRIFQHQA